VHVTTLIDEQATKDGITAAVADVAARAHGQDTLVVFLPGHGVTLGQRYYFLAHDFQQQAATLEDDVRQHGLAEDVLGERLAQVPALKRVLIYDTCQSGGALALSRTGRDAFAFRGALERLSRAQGIFAIAAASATAQAHEVPELKHGMLTYAAWTPARWPVRRPIPRATPRWPKSATGSRSPKTRCRC
jgi:uncharacterized caspase-like protein